MNLHDFEIGPRALFHQGQRPPSRLRPTLLHCQSRQTTQIPSASCRPHDSADTRSPLGRDSYRGPFLSPMTMASCPAMPSSREVRKNFPSCPHVDLTHLRAEFGFLVWARLRIGNVSVACYLLLSRKSSSSRPKCFLTALN